MAARQRPDFSNGFGAHENPSHTAIAIRPASASEIRYAVMSGLYRSESMCGMTAFIRSFQARTLSLQARSTWRIVARGRVRTWTWATPRAGTFAPCRLTLVKGSDGNALCDAWRQCAWGDGAP
jgi:hypothetical protein